jgi:hypothetical protein
MDVYDGLLTGRNIPAIERWYKRSWVPSSHDELQLLRANERSMRLRPVSISNLYMFPENTRDKYKWSSVKYAGWFKWNDVSTIQLDAMIHDTSDAAILKYVKTQPSGTLVTVFDAMTSVPKKARLEVTFEALNKAIITDVKEIITA